MMKYEEIISGIQKKIYHPVYFLYGKEPYYIDLISDYISENVLPPEEQAFNQFIFYGKDSDLNQIIGQAKKFPMMSNNQVIIVREAQSMKGLTSAPTKTKANPFLIYAQNPLPSTILVVCYKIATDSTEKFSAGFMNGLGKKSVVFESKQLYENELPSFIQHYVKSRKFSISPNASMLLVESIGSSLTTLVREIEKLFIALPSGKTDITEDLVERNIGISREYNIFELQNRIAEGNKAKALKIAHFLAERQGGKVVYMIDRIFDFFTKTLKYQVISKGKGEQDIATELGVNRYFLKNYVTASRIYPPGKIVVVVSLLREYDLKCKGLGSTDDNSELFKELIAKILYL